MVAFRTANAQDSDTVSDWFTCSWYFQDILAREHWHRRHSELMRLVNMLATWKAEGQGTRDVLLTTGTGGGISCGRSDCDDARQALSLVLKCCVLWCLTCQASRHSSLAI